MLFRPNPDLEKELQGDSDYDEALREQAEVAAGRAETYARAAGAPWMPRPGQETVVVEQDEDGTRIVNLDYAGHLLEFGSVNNPPHAPLRRGALSAGLRIVESE